MLIDYTIHRGEGRCPLRHSKEENATIYRAYVISNALRLATQLPLRSLPLVSISFLDTKACFCSESIHCCHNSSLNAEHYCAGLTAPAADNDEATTLESAAIKNCGPACTSPEDDIEEHIIFILKIPGRKNRGKGTRSLMPSDWKGRFERLCSAASPPLKPIKNKKPTSMILSVLTERRPSEPGGVLLRSISYSSSWIRIKPFGVDLGGPY
jgi:hypothetical protein